MIKVITYVNYILLWFCRFDMILRSGLVINLKYKVFQFLQ